MCNAANTADIQYASNADLSEEDLVTRAQLPCVLRRQTASEHEVGEVVCQTQDVTCNHGCVGSHSSSAAGRSHDAEQV